MTTETNQLRNKAIELLKGKMHFIFEDTCKCSITCITDEKVTFKYSINNRTGWKKTADFIEWVNDGSFTPCDRKGNV